MILAFAARLARKNMIYCMNFEAGENHVRRRSLLFFQITGLHNMHIALRERDSKAFLSKY